MTIKKTLLERRNTLDEDVVKLDEVWKDMLEACKDNLQDTIEFITNECGVDDMNMLSEIFDELVYQIQSPELVIAIRDAACRYPDTDKRYFLKVLDESVDDFGNHAVKSAYRKAQEDDNQ